MTNIRIQDAASLAELDEVRALMRAFTAWQRVRYAAHVDLVDLYFDAKAYEEELRTLPGKYAPPEGALLIASLDGRAAGCVAMRPMADQTCEMKRMFVYPEFQGLGVGAGLARGLIERGRNAGYRAMRLETGSLQVEALGLYEKLGFRKGPPYYAVPKELESAMVCMELSFK